MAIAITPSRAQLALWLAWSALGLTALSGVLAAVAVLGYRARWFDLAVARHGVLLASVVTACLAVVLIMVRVGIVLRSDRTPGVVPAMIALLGAVALLWGPTSQIRMTHSLPTLRDVTTDFGDPPVFAAPREESCARSSSADYGGPALAQAQKAAYPDIMPIMLSEDARSAFTRAYAAAQRLGWTIVSADPDTGRIEACVASFWFRLVDDVVIRVRPQGEGSRVDVRSVSREKASESGSANARRIRKFTSLLMKE